MNFVNIQRNKNFFKKKVLSWGPSLKSFTETGKSLFFIRQTKLKVNMKITKRQGIKITKNYDDAF